MLVTCCRFLSLAVATACTTVLVPTEEGTVIGRTMELGIPYLKGELEHILVHPQNTSIATLRGALPPSKFGFVTVQVALSKNLSVPFGTTEGINEAGLTVSVQTHTLAVYEDHNASKEVAIGDLTASEYMLGCCSTVDAAADALSRLNLIPTPGIGQTALGSVHWSLQDATGSSRVIEFVDGRMRVYDNTDVGVLTNDPSYEWQLGNLNQYAAYPTTHTETKFELQAKSRGPFTSFSVSAKDGTTSTPVDRSHGVHTKFLPGGYTPPDRFIKMFLLRQTAAAHARPATLDEGIILATGLLNTVHIPRGAVAGPGLLEYTNWAVLKVPKGRGAPERTRPEQPHTSSAEMAATAAPLMYYRTYDNMQWKRLDLGKLDFSGATQYAPIPLFEPGMGIREVTPK